MQASVQNALAGHDDFVRNAKGNEFGANLDAQAGKVISATVGPLDINILERQIALRGPDVFLHVGHRPPHRSIDAVGGDDDAAAKSETLAQHTLPLMNSFGIG